MNARVRDLAPFQPAALAERFGTRPLELGDGPPTTIARYLRWIRRAHREGRAHEVTYARNLWLSDVLPELVPLIDEPNICAGNLLPGMRDVPDQWRVWRELFISGPGVRYPDVHVDTHLTRAWITQLAGEKTLFLWAPPRGDLKRLVEWARYTVRVDATTDLDSLFEQPSERLTLRPGQTAILPPGWMHTTETNSLSVSVSGNFLLPVDLGGYRSFMNLPSTR